MPKLKFYTVREILNTRFAQRMAQVNEVINRFDNIVIVTDNLLDNLGQPRRFTNKGN